MFSDISLPPKNILISNITPISIELTKLLIKQGYNNITLHDINNNYANRNMVLKKFDTIIPTYVIKPLDIKTINNYDIIIFVDTPFIMTNKYIIHLQTVGISYQISHNYETNEINKNTSNDIGVTHKFKNKKPIMNKKIMNDNNILINPIAIGQLFTEILKITYNNPTLTQNMNFQYFESFNLNNIDLKTLKNISCCIIGMGAIGTTLLYNLLNIGVTHIHIIDDKQIKKNNVNTHMFVNNNDIGMHKIDVMEKFINNNYPNVVVTKYNCNINNTNETIFNKKFYEMFGCIFNCVDNLSSRTYIHNRCNIFKIPNIVCDNNKLDGIINTCVPYITDIQEQKDIEPIIIHPLCNISLYPTTMEHAILWAKEKLNNIFVDNLILFEKYLGDPKLVITDDNKIMIMEMFELINVDNVGNKMFNKYFVDQINELLVKFPSDYMLDDGTLFWQLPKVCPHVIDNNNDYYLGFVDEIVKLWNCAIMVNGIVDFNDINTYKNITITKPKINSKIVYFMSSLRALNYDIEIVDKFVNHNIYKQKIHKLLGINFMLSGMAILELCKIINKYGNYKNNVITNGIIKTNDTPLCDKNNKYTIWDTFVVTSDIIYVKDFIEYFKITHNIVITSIILGSQIIYNEMFDDDIETKLNISLHDMLIKNNVSSLTLQIFDDSDDDIDLPNVLYIL